MADAKTIASVVEALAADLQHASLNETERKEKLETLKTCSRTPATAKLLATPEAIKTLTGQAYRSEATSINSQTSTTGSEASVLTPPATSTVREALKCLGNVLLLEPTTRQFFIDADGIPRSVQLLQDPDLEAQFLSARLLFLSTYEKSFDFGPLIKDGLATTVNRDLALHVEHDQDEEGPYVSSMGDMALTELLKLFFNLTQLWPDDRPLFNDSIGSLMALLQETELPVPPLQPPVIYLLNALLNVEPIQAEGRVESTDLFFPKADPSSLVDRLLEILQAAVTDSTDAQLEENAMPLLLILRKIYSVAPEQIQAQIRKTCLPSETDRDKPLGQSDTLPSRLLRLTASAAARQVAPSVQHFLFELSNQDAAQFVQNVGYGYASGFLANNKIPFAQADMSEASDGTEAVNPITGQRLDREPAVELPPMTDEEKEREAERLFVLFERLRATGVVNVENPVREALEKGRIEEME